MQGVWLSFTNRLPRPVAWALAGRILTALAGPAWADSGARRSDSQKGRGYRPFCSPGASPLLLAYSSSNVGHGLIGSVRWKFSKMYCGWPSGAA